MNDSKDAVTDILKAIGALSPEHRIKLFIALNKYCLECGKVGKLTNVISPDYTYSCTGNTKDPHPMECW